MTQKAQRVGRVSDQTRLLTLKREASLNQALLATTKQTQNNGGSTSKTSNRNSVSRQSLGSTSGHMIPFPVVSGSRAGHLTTKSTHSSNKCHKNKRSLVRSQNLQAQQESSTVFRNKGSSVSGFSSFTRRNSNANSQSTTAFAGSALLQKSLQQTQSSKRDLNTRSIQKKHLLLNKDRLSISKAVSPSGNPNQIRSLAQSGFIQKISQRKYSTVTSSGGASSKGKAQGSLSNNLGAKINEILSHAKMIGPDSNNDIDRLKSELSKYCGKNLNFSSKPRSLISKGQLVGQQSHNDLFGGTTRTQKASRLHQRHGTDVAVSGGLNMRENSHQTTDEEDEEPSIIAVDAAQLFEQKEQIELKAQNQNETKDVDQIDIRVENVDLRKKQIQMKTPKEGSEPQKQTKLPQKASNLLSQWRKVYESPLLNAAPISQRIYKAAPSERSRSGKAGSQIVTGETGMKKSFSIAQIQTVRNQRKPMINQQQQQMSEYGPRGSPRVGLDSLRSGSFEDTYGRKEITAMKRSESIQSLSSGGSIPSTYRRPIVVADRGTSQMGVLKNLAQSSRQATTKLFQNQPKMTPKTVKVASLDEQARANVIRETGSVLKKFKYGDSLRSSINSQNFESIRNGVVSKVPQSCKNSQIFGYKVEGKLSESRHGGTQALNSRKTSIDNQSGSSKFEDLNVLRQASTPSHQFAPKVLAPKIQHQNYLTIQDENGHLNLGQQKSKSKFISHKNSKSSQQNSVQNSRQGSELKRRKSAEKVSSIQNCKLLSVTQKAHLQGHSPITNKVLKRQGSAVQIEQQRLAQNRKSVPLLQSINEQAVQAKKREQGAGVVSSSGADRRNEQWQLQQPNINLKRKSMIVSPIIGHQTTKSRSRQNSASKQKNKTSVTEPKQTPLLFKKSPVQLETKKVEKRTIPLPESKKMGRGSSPKENVQRVIQQGQSPKETNKSVEKQGKFVDRLINFIEHKSPKTASNKVQQIQEQPQVNQLIQKLLKASLKTRQASLEKLEKPVLSPRNRSKSREDSQKRQIRVRNTIVGSKKQQNQAVQPCLEQSGQVKEEKGTRNLLKVEKVKSSVNNNQSKVVQKVQGKKKSESVTPVGNKRESTGRLQCEQSQSLASSSPNPHNRQSISPNQVYYAPQLAKNQSSKQIQEDDSYSKITKSFKMHFSGVSPNVEVNSSYSKMTPTNEKNFSEAAKLAKNVQLQPQNCSSQQLIYEGQSGQQNYYTVKASDNRSGAGSSRFLSRQSSQNTLPKVSKDHEIIVSPKSELRDRSSSQRLSEAKQSEVDLESPVQICIKPYKKGQHKRKKSRGSDEQLKQRGDIVDTLQQKGSFTQKYSTEDRKVSNEESSENTSLRSTDTLVSSIKRHFSTPQGWVLPFQTTLRCYRVDKIVGKGAFGKVALAFQRLTEKPVAIKMIDKESLQPGQLEKVQTEVRLMSAIRHKNIIRLLEVFETRQYLFMVFEYAKNGDLLQLVKKTGCLTEEEAVPLFRQVVYGIAHCHCRSVLHRDIKLDNILLDSRFNVKICDFGISRLIPDPSEPVFEQCGTPAYIAPEILCEDGYKGFKSDIWGLGVLLYTMVTGTVPFRAQNMAELRQVITQGHFQFPSKHPRDCLDRYSPEIKDLIRRCLCVNIDQRISIPDILSHPWLNPPLPHQIQQQGLNIQQLLSLHALQPFNSSKKQNVDFLSVDRQENPNDAVYQIKLENLFPQKEAHFGDKTKGVDTRTMTQDDVDEVTIDRATVNINEVAVAELEKCGFPKKLTRLQVQANVLSHATAAYHLLVL